MSVRTWIGREPTGYEAGALRQLHASLSEADPACHLMANFLVDGREIDLFAVKPNGLFLIELKKVHGAVTGTINGVWTVQDENSAYRLNGGRGENPYQQMMGQYYALTNWLERHKRDFLSEYAAEITRFRHDRDAPDTDPPVKIKSLVSFYPDLPAESKLELDWKVDAIGFPELPQILAIQDTPRANFTDDEIVRLARTLHVRPWTALEACHPYGGPITTRLATDNALKLTPALRCALGDCWRYLQLTALDIIICRLTRRRNGLLCALTDPESGIEESGQKRVLLLSETAQFAMGET